MIALEVPQVEEKPVRSADLPKRETGTGTQPVGKGMDWEAVYQRRRSKTWMIWVKLNCLKSSGQLEAGTPLTQRLSSSPNRRRLSEPGERIPPVRNNGQ
jgi:hypothetical protein